MTVANVVVTLCQFALCVAGVAFFTGFESAFAAMSKVKLRHRAAQGLEGADFLEHLYAEREKFLGFTLVGMTLAFVCGVVVAVRFFLQGEGVWLPVGWAVPVAALSCVPFLLVAGEMIPRTLARRHADEAVGQLVRPVMVTYAFLYVPLVFVTGAVTRAVMRLLGAERSGLELRASKEELRLLVRMGEKEGIVERDEGAMIESIFDFQGKTAADCLTPRVEIHARPRTVTIGEVAQAMISSGHSRIPLTGEDLDDIIGIVHALDLLTTKHGPGEPADLLLQKVSRVPAGKALSVLLREFQATHEHMAVVIGEHGETLGLITLEDILEEIVGEMRDEFDDEEPPIIEELPGVFLVDSMVSRSEFERRFGVALPEGSYDTFGGFLLHLWRRIPVQGEERRYGGLSVTVVRADAQRVQKARVTRVPTAATGLAGAGDRTKSGGRG